MTLQQLIELAAGRNYDRDADLPYPNIYWATIRSAGRPQVDTWLAAEHTAIALAKAGNWCARTHLWRPQRSDSRILLRRFKLGDLLGNPAAYATALMNAQEAGERDIVDSLERMPAKIAKTLGLVARVSQDDLWAQLSKEIAELGPGTQRSLRY